jgi:uncharacterized protein (DUF58 family)
VVKRYQPAIARETLICLDMSLRNYEVRRRHESIELAVVVAASLASHMIERERLPVGLAADALDPLDGVRRRFFLPPASERAHLMSLLEVLARVQATPEGSLADLLRRESLALAWGSTLVAVTGSIDDELRETLLYLKRSGHAMALILVGPEHVRADRAREESVPGVPVHHVTSVRELAVVS